MKAVFIITLLLVASALARSAVKPTAEETGPACPIPDPLVREAGPLNITLEPILVIEVGGQRGELVAKGLSTLNYTYDIQELLLTAKFAIDLKAIDIQTSYSDVVGWVDTTPLRPETLPSGDFEGKGNAHITGTNLKVKASAALFINLIGNKVSVRTLNVETLSFDSATLNLGQEFLLNGKPVDFAAISNNFKTNFDEDFAKFEKEIVERVRVAVNVIIGKYTLAELIDLIGNIGGGGGEGCPPEL